MRLKKTVQNSTINDIKEIVNDILLFYNKNNYNINIFMFSISLFCLYKQNLIKFNKNNEFISNNTLFNHFLSDWYDKTENNNEMLDFSIKQFNDLLFYDKIKNKKDFIGTIYESLRDFNNKSKLGAYYTPNEITSDIIIPLGNTVLDPCAGAGTLILNVVDKKHLPSDITLRDVDELALNIAKVSFCLFFNRTDILIKTEVVSILFDRKKEVFDYVLTNPPYGVKLSEKDKKDILNTYHNLKTTESFNIAIYNSLNKINELGKIYFVLPESLLYVDVHFNMREFLFGLKKEIKITHYGSAFKGVMSKIIRLDIKNSDTTKIHIKNNEFEWIVPNDILVKNNYRPPNINNLGELDIISKILNVDSFTLENKCKFGLGIVTGDNKKHLKTNEIQGLEIIFTGKELNAFKFDKPKYFIDFQPKNLQQVAPIELYRQNKICYCFISNKITTLVDENNSLTLNSVNFFIPDKTIPMKALSTILNSDVITFIYRKLYVSVKVLRNHFESFPIPISFYDNIGLLEDLYDKNKNNDSCMNELNDFVGGLFGLNQKEIDYISESLK